MKHQIVLPLVILKTKNSYNAFSPLIDGCVAVDETIDKVLRQFPKTLSMHLKYDESAKQKLLKRCQSLLLSKYVKEFGPSALYTFLTIAVDG